MSLSARSGAQEGSKTIGKIHVLDAGTWPKPAVSRTALNVPWQKNDAKDILADVCCLKNLHAILQETPATMEGADVYILECRGAARRGQVVRA